MERPLRVKIAQCLAYGFLFLFFGWLMKKVDLDIRSIRNGGKYVMASGTILLAWGAWLYAVGTGLKARFGLPLTLGGIALSLVAMSYTFDGLVSLGGRAGLSDRLTEILLLIGVECFIFYWVDRKGRQDPA